MRSALDTLYRLSGALSAFFLMMIGVSIVGQIAGRFINVAFDATEISGFCMAASMFLGLAYTFRAGAHIRVSLLITRLGLGGRRWVQILCCALGGFGCIYFAVNVWMIVLESREFGDTSPGLMAVPFWIPQIGMAVGISIMAIAFLDEMVAVLRGKQPDFTDAEAQAIGEIELVEVPAENAKSRDMAGAVR